MELEEVKVNIDELYRIFEAALKKPPAGVLTIIGALQWRMQYGILAKEDKTY